jgi:hypothetical protein
MSFAWAWRQGDDSAAARRMAAKVRGRLIFEGELRVRRVVAWVGLLISTYRECAIHGGTDGFCVVRSGPG